MKLDISLKDLADDEVALKRLIDNGRLKQLTYQILGNDDLLASIAKRSCEHVNGFSLIRLRTTENPYERLRLHVFEGKCPLGDPHTHRWGFSSVILCGQLKHEIFQESDQGEEFLRTECLPKQHGFHLQKANPTRLVITQRTTLNPGDSYYLTGREIHRFGPQGRTEAMSLVIQRKPFSISSTVYLKLGKQMGTGVMAALPVEKLTDILKRLGRLL